MSRMIAPTWLTLISWSLAHNIGVLFGVASCSRANDAEWRARLRAKAVVVAAERLEHQIKEAGIALGAFSITKSPLYSDRFDKLFSRIPNSLKDLERAVGEEDLDQVVIMERVSELADDCIRFLKLKKDKMFDEDVAVHRARHFTDGSADTVRDFEAALQMLTESERRLDAEELEPTSRNREKMNALLKIGACGNILISCAIALFAFAGARRAK